MGKYVSLKENDVYSLVLFALYKIMGDPEFSTIGELAYTLDHDNFLKFIETFGGTTMKVPTVDQLETVVFALLIFQRVDVGKEKFTTVVRDIDNRSNDISEILTVYEKLKDVLKNYEFKRRSSGQ